MKRLQRVLVSLPVSVLAVALTPGLSAGGQEPKPKPVKHKAPEHYVEKHKLQSVPGHQVDSHRAVSHPMTAKTSASHSVSSHQALASPKRKSNRRVRHTKTRLPAGPSSDRIEQIQQALTRSGYSPGGTTGKWDQDTVDAMRHFQQAEGITPTGKIDASSLQKLGLGSDVAGVSAPRPTMPVETTGSGTRESDKGAGGVL